ncbi:acyl-CoA dehydrogenase family protein [Pseudonocardia nematodicida]|uniref:Acyl-CoA dehydrogenase family protein n=1 Tax=Pseudonocardia nematodicida TaxID=1206997 RepID=A0ABV1KAE3_9PSEU
MYFALTDEQREFGAAVRGYLSERFDPAAVRAAVVDEPDSGGNPASLWKAAGEQGWLAVTVDEAYDGLGLGLVEAQVIARALGAGVAPGPWRGTVLAAETIRLAGSDEQRAAWLPRLAAGDAIGAAAPRTAADGTLPAVEYGGIADVVAVWDEPALVSGASATPVGSFDRTTRLAALTGGTAEPLPGLTAEVRAQLERRARVLVAADLTGIAREALTRTVAYDRDREQFGVPVGSFQAIKHALADLHVGVTMAEHASLYAAHAVDAGLGGAGPDGVDLAVAVAKAKASDVALQATAAMIQYHGGIGYTWEHEAHLFHKRAKRLAGQYGDVAAHRERIAALTI